MLGTGFGLAFAVSGSFVGDETLTKLPDDKLRSVASEWESLSFGGKILATCNPFEDVQLRSRQAKELLVRRAQNSSNAGCQIGGTF